MGDIPPTGTEPDPRLGTTVAGRYLLCDRIGRGGMGAIYEAEHLTTGKRFAIKTLLPGLGGVEEIARRFEREARAASVLSHPNIVSVSDFGAFEDGSLYLVMELVRGRPLGDVMDDETITTARAIAIGRQVLEALAHAHQAGVIHRDLKPDNIMLVDLGLTDEERDIVKLLDFGIAKIVDEAGAAAGDKLTRAGVAFGTPDYMSPEQALGESVDNRADLYAAAIILFELLTGQRPFENSDKMAVLRMQVSLAPPSLAEAGPPGRLYAKPLEKLIARGLAKRREDRPASAEEMIDALDAASLAQAALDGETAVEIARATADSMRGLAPFDAEASTTAPTPSPRPRVRTIALTVALLAAVGLIAVFARGGSSTPAARPAAARAAAPMPAPMLAQAARARPEIVARAQKMLTAGDAAGAVAALEPELSGPPGSLDGRAHLVLGHARTLAGHDVEALVAYQRAIELVPDAAADAKLRSNVEAMVDRRDKRAALAALDLLADQAIPPDEALIVEQASRGKNKDVRRRARDIAERLALSSRVDLVSSYGLDLQQGASCRERREAIPRLRALGDKQAIPLLKRAAGRTGGFLGLQDVNDCLERDAVEAIEFLQALK